MAVRLLSSEVSDICIGKPAARWMPLTATIGNALLALIRSGEYCFAVCSTGENNQCTGRVTMIDIICYVCADDNIADPIAALRRPLASLIPENASTFFCVDPHSSLIEALDMILTGAHSLVVPFRSSFPRRSVSAEFCWLTREDFVRFFLNSIARFSPIPYLTITELGLICRDTLTIRSHEPALSALPLLSRALAEQTSVAVVTEAGGRRLLIGEISPSAFSYCDETTAAALTVLSAGEFMAYINYCGAVHSVKERLGKKGMTGMLELIELGFSSGAAYSSSSSSSWRSASSSDDDEEARAGLRRMRRRTGWMSCSAWKGRRSEEVVVCHPESTLVAVILQALTHRVSYVWVVDDDEEDALVGVVSFLDVLQVFREQLIST